MTPTSPRSAADEPRLIPVPDAILALRALARYHRDRFAIPVLGLTGTNGKTTTKELINAVLSARFRTHATCGNLNNNIGVPLTILGMPADTEIAVIEMGASHPGDIKELISDSSQMSARDTFWGLARLRA